MSEVKAKYRGTLIKGNTDWTLEFIQRQNVVILSLDELFPSASYSVMQSDGNSWKIDTFREAITSELLISS